jgi:predicted RNase H-like nuclease (RuvC/YqgF family)
LKKKSSPTPHKEAPKADNSKERKALQRQIQNLEKHIERLETEKGQLESEMAISDFYMKPDSDAKTRRYDVILKELEAKTNEWERLVSEFEGGL